MVRFETWTMPAAAMGQTNPLPDIKNVGYIHAGYALTDRVPEEDRTYLGKGMLATMLPYRLQDDYGRDRAPQEFVAAVVENDHLKAVFLPQLGGRLWSLYDKTQNRELLYTNPVFQPGNLALRNAWFSGGVEFNVGIKGHSPLTCSPVWCAVDETEDGQILRLYEYERIRGVVYSISAWLPEHGRALYLRGRIENPHEREVPMYWWSNIAVPETEGTRVIVPAAESLLSFYNEDHYLVDCVPFPVNQGRDSSYPAAIPASGDFFFRVPDREKKWIAAVDEGGKGLAQCSTAELTGRKLFVWGQGAGGRNWNEWLSVEGSAYIEIQAGLAHTQLEHRPMAPGDVWEWTEAYLGVDVPPRQVHGDYKTAVDTVAAQIRACVGDPDNLNFPGDDRVLKTEICFRGSGWGSLEERLLGRPISRTLAFPAGATEETAQWETLLTEGVFPTPAVTADPGSYVVGTRWQDLLEQLPNQNWYSLLHLGVVRYANGDVEGSREAWEQSVALQPSPWAWRNLAMLQKNEYGQKDKAKACMLRALELLPHCRAICVETADLLTATGDDGLWLQIYGDLPGSLRQVGRLRLYCAVALLHLNRPEEAAKIVNKEFVMSDIKEGELSISKLWFDVYRSLYAARHGGRADDPKLWEAADAAYPLPCHLDFRMH